MERELSDGLISDDEAPAPAPLSVRLRQRRNRSPETPRVSAMNASLEAAIAHHSEIMRAADATAQRTDKDSSAEAAGAGACARAGAADSVNATDATSQAEPHAQTAGSGPRSLDGSAAALPTVEGNRSHDTSEHAHIHAQRASPAASAAAPASQPESPAALPQPSVCGPDAPAQRSADASTVRRSVWLSGLTAEQEAELQHIGLALESARKPVQLGSHTWQPTSTLFDPACTNGAGGGGAAGGGAEAQAAAATLTAGLTWQQTRELEGISADGIEQYATLHRRLWRPPVAAAEAAQDAALPSERSGYCTEHSDSSGAADSAAAAPAEAEDSVWDQDLSAGGRGKVSRARQLQEATRRRLLDSDASSSSDVDSSMAEGRAVEVLSASLRAHVIGA